MKDWGFISKRALEAAACGAFVISDYSSAVPDVFDNLLITYRDQKDFVNKASFFLGNEKARTEIANRIKDHVLKKHTLKNRTPVILDVLNQLRVSKGIKKRVSPKKLSIPEGNYWSFWRLFNRGRIKKYPFSIPPPTMPEKTTASPIGENISIFNISILFSTKLDATTWDVGPTWLRQRLENPLRTFLTLFIKTPGSTYISFLLLPITTTFTFHLGTKGKLGIPG